MPAELPVIDRVFWCGTFLAVGQSQLNDTAIIGW
jgi:hypothetical protein